jgi:hypothetical protein
MIDFLQTDVEFTCVAIDVGENCEIYTCCDKDLSDLRCLKPFLGPRIDHITRQLRVLHGFVPLGGIDNKTFPGRDALNDVFLFMKKAGPLDHEIYRFEKCVGFKTYTEEKAYYPLIGLYRVNMDVYAEHSITSTLAPMKRNSWEGNKKPTFQLARRSKPIPPGQAFEKVALTIKGAGQHRMLWWKAREITKQRCLCTVSPPQYSVPGDYIFKFMGRQSDVSVGREVFAGEIQKAKTIFKAKIPLIDAREAALLTGKTQTSGEVPNII